MNPLNNLSEMKDSPSLLIRNDSARSGIGVGGGGCVVVRGGAFAAGWPSARFGRGRARPSAAVSAALAQDRANPDLRTTASDETRIAAPPSHRITGDAPGRGRRRRCPGRGRRPSARRDVHIALANDGWNWAVSGGGCTVDDGVQYLGGGLSVQDFSWAAVELVLDGPDLEAYSAGACVYFRETIL